MIIQENSQVIDEFHSYLSKLDYYNDLDENKQSIQRNLEKDDNIQQFKFQRQESIDSVPLKFASETYYIQLWKKLFLYEAKAQILRAKLDEASQPEKVEIMKSQFIAPFRYFTFNRIEQSKVIYGNGNLVIISPDNPKNQNVDHVLGFIEGGDQLKVKLIFQGLKENKDIEKLTEKQKESFEKEKKKWEKLDCTKQWYIQNLCGIVTLERQFKALSKFNSNKLKNIILNPYDYINCVEEKFQIPQQLDLKLKKVYNESQYKAIHECLKKKGITLIQGPPGTGKTKTVLGTLSVLLNSYNQTTNNLEQIIYTKVVNNSEKIAKLNPWMSNYYSDWRDQIFFELPEDLVSYQSTKQYVKSPVTDRQIIIRKKQEDVIIPGKILICGPSNAAVDQIIRKILSQGLLDSKGKIYNPSIVRIGQNFDSSLENVSLQYLATQQMNLKGLKEDLSYYRNKILKENKLVCGTLSAAGHQFLQGSGIVFDTIIIDEACQAVQISALIPMTYGSQRLILIGDPNQLPSTIFSRRCLRQSYDQSLFERMMKCGYNVNILRTQYRMHPLISSVIGSTFYNSLLLDSSNILNILKQHKLYKFFEPFIFFNVEGSSEIMFKNSFRNIQQAKAIKLLVNFLLENKCDDIGILSPYSQQISYLQSQGYPKQCQIKTIDSFQGRQKSIIIFNTVRSGLTGEPGKQKKNFKKTIGFLSDKRRVNVGLSRAKHICIVVGDANRLSQFQIWNEIILGALEKKQIYNFTQQKDYFKEFKQNKLKFLKTKLKK